MAPFLQYWFGSTGWFVDVLNSSEAGMTGNGIRSYSVELVGATRYSWIVPRDVGVPQPDQQRQSQLAEGQHPCEPATSQYESPNRLQSARASTWSETNGYDAFRQLLQP